jgi:internalin A
MAMVPAEPVSRPWRKLLRFSVRGLIVVVLVCGVWLGWLVRSARIQRDAVAAITRAGGAVKYDYGWTKGEYIFGGEHVRPGRLAALIGIDFFVRVTDAWLYSSSTDVDASLVQVGRLTQLERLSLYRAPFSDAGLVQLKRLTKLSELDLGDTQVSDAGLAHLRGLTNLSSLNLSGTQVTDAGLAHLTGLTMLKILGLGHTRVTDAGLAHLKRLKSLSSVGLFATPVTSAGVEELQQSSPSLWIVH